MVNKIVEKNSKFKIFEVKEERDANLRTQRQIEMQKDAEAEDSNKKMQKQMIQIKRCKIKEAKKFKPEKHVKLKKKSHFSLKLTPNPQKSFRSTWLIQTKNIHQLHNNSKNIPIQN